MSTGIQLLTRLTRTSFSLRQDGFLLAVANPERMVCVSPTTLSPGCRIFASQDAAHNDAGHSVLFTRAQHLQPDLVASRRRCDGFWLHRHPDRRRVLQSGVSVKRHLSCIFPAHPRSLARCLSRALRHGASLLRLCRPPGYGFQKIFSANLRKERGRKDFPNLP